MTVLIPTAVYRCYDEAGALIYVGATADLPRRLRSHERTSPWWSHTLRIDITWYGSRAEALDAEAVAIRMERPVWNHTHLSGWSTTAIARRWRPTSAAQVAALDRVSTAVEPTGRTAAVLAAWQLGVPPTIVARAARGRLLRVPRAPELS